MSSLKRILFLFAFLCIHVCYSLPPLIRQTKQEGLFGDSLVGVNRMMPQVPHLHREREEIRNKAHFLDLKKSSPILLPKITTQAHPKEKVAKENVRLEKGIMLQMPDLVRSALLNGASITSITDSQVLDSIVLTDPSTLKLLYRYGLSNNLQNYRPLTAAVRFCCYSKIKLLVHQLGASCENEGGQPLLDAIRQRDLRMTNLLRTYDKSAHLEVIDPSGKTPYKLAQSSFVSEEVQKDFMNSREADKESMIAENVENSQPKLSNKKKSETPAEQDLPPLIHSTEEEVPPFTHINEDQPSLIQYDYDPSQYRSLEKPFCFSKNYREFFEALEEGKYYQIECYLRQPIFNIDVNAYDGFALKYAARTNDERMLELLWRYGGTINNFNLTWWAIFSYKVQFDTLDYLLKKGVSCYITDEELKVVSQEQKLRMVLQKMNVDIAS